MTQKEIFEWATIVGLLLLGVFTMYTIKREKQDYLSTGFDFEFHGFHFLVPRWWTRMSFDPNYASFERTDTRYDWIAEFRWFETDPGTPIEKIFKDIIIEKKIIFDMDSSVIYNPTDFHKNKWVNDGRVEIVRIEGTASEDVAERIYYDAFLIRDKTRNKSMFCSSRSGVLNGGIEGPYFEEALINFSLD